MTSDKHLVAWNDAPPNYITCDPLPASAIPGQVFWNGTTNKLSVWNGNYWQDIDQPQSNVVMQPESSAAIDWAIEKMREMNH